MSFQVNKMHKLQDQIESLTYDWVWEDIQEQYGVEEVEQLNQEQIDEISTFAESEECYEGYVSMTLRSICDSWEADL